jgi:co-chaperonin GroES (HSP10)
MRISPCGYYVLVDITKSESVSKGGIVLPDELILKEQMAEETGTISAFGPTCFIGMRGCTEEDIERTGKTAPELWGLKVGDKVEFKRFEGKKSFVKGLENYRYIPDTHIIGVIYEA